MSIAYISPFPYIFMLIIFAVILSVCFYRFPTLRVYRSKRNLLIYALVVLLLTLTAYQAYDVALGPALVSCRLVNNGANLYAGRVNQFDVSCSTGGLRETHFNLVIESVNATLIADGQSGYIQISNTTIKIPFTFEGFNLHASESKPVMFTIDENVASFEFYPYVEGKNGGPVVTSSFTCARGTWNDTTSSYRFGAVSMFM